MINDTNILPKYISGEAWAVLLQIKTEKPSASKPVKPENRFFSFNFYFNRMRRNCGIF
jgi:hypothetical protein